MRLMTAGLLAALAALAQVTVESHSGAVQFRLAAANEYSITFRGKPAIEGSAIGIVVNQIHHSDGAVIGTTDRYQVVRIVRVVWRPLKSDRQGERVPDRDATQQDRAVIHVGSACLQ